MRTTYFNKHTLLLAVIVLVSFITRAYNSSINPLILNRDEAALAYNALLLNQTGMDEWRKTWPLTLESFGDFKLIGYPAVLSLIYPAFPLSDGLVRLPSLLAGSLLALIGYFFVRFLKLDTSLSLLGALFIATAPFSIFYSKMAYEANLALLLFSIAIVLALSNTAYSYVKDILVLILFILAALTYNTPLLLLPFVLLTIILYRGIKNWKSWKLLALGTSVLCIVFMSLLQQLTAQKSSVTIFSDELYREQSIAYRNQFSEPLQTLVGNKYVFFTKEIIKKTIASFSPKFLVSEGGSHPWHSLPNWGHMYVLTYVLGLLAILITCIRLLGRAVFEIADKKVLRSLTSPLSKSFTGKRASLLLLLFFSLAPSVVTVDSPHATRSLLFLLLFHVFATIGIYDLTILINNYLGSFSLWQRIEAHLISMVAISLLLFSSLYMYEYHTEYPKVQKFILNAGFDTTIDQIEREFPDKNIAIVDNEGYHYILTAWYLRMSPQEYFDTVVRQLPNQIGFRYGEQVGRYHFIAHKSDRSDDESVLVYFDGSDWQVEIF